MSMPIVSAARADAIVGGFSRARILVVGDVMLDRFIVGRVTRISPEAPVPVVRFESERLRLGGAANVAHNITALGGGVSLIGVVGADAASERLQRELTAARIDTTGLIVDPRRPTTAKVRVVTERNQQVARIDYEDDTDIEAAVEQAVIDRITAGGAEADALLVSDYLKGVVTHGVMDALLALSRSGVGSRDAAAAPRPLIVDPKIPHLACYAGATLITPNHHEAEIATHCRIRSDEDARHAAREFRERARCGGVLITRGEHGMWLSDGSHEGAVPATAREVSDVTGAGDTVVAALALALAAGATTAEAAIVANHAAGIVVGKFGPATVTPDELRETFRS